MPGSGKVACFINRCRSSSPRQPPSQPNLNTVKDASRLSFIPKIGAFLKQSFHRFSARIYTDSWTVPNTSSYIKSLN